MAKNTFIILILGFFSLGAGCNSVSGIFENTTVVDIATRQAVFRYIDSGRDEISKGERATQVVQKIDLALKYLEGSPTATVDTLISTLEKNIEWDKLERADRLLVSDIMALLRASLEAKQQEGILDEDKVLKLRSILNMAVSTARLLQ